MHLSVFDACARARTHTFSHANIYTDYQGLDRRENKARPTDTARSLARLHASTHARTDRTLRTPIQQPTSVHQHTYAHRQTNPDRKTVTDRFCFSTNPPPPMRAHTQTHTHARTHAPSPLSHTPFKLFPLLPPPFPSPSHTRPTHPPTLFPESFTLRSKIYFIGNDYQVGAAEGRASGGKVDIEKMGGGEEG